MMSTIVGFANPAYAAVAESVPESTAAAMASTDAVRMGNAPMTTEKIVAAKMANRCHAWAVSCPDGGMNQIASATASAIARARRFGFSRYGAGAGAGAGESGFGPPFDSSSDRRGNGRATRHLLRRCYRPEPVRAAGLKISSI